MIRQRFITSAVHNIMSRGISQQLVLPQGGGFGLKGGVLDKEAFCKTISVLAAKVPPEKAGVLLNAPALRKCVHLRPTSALRARDTDLRPDFLRSLLDVPKVKSVARGPNQERLVLLKFTNKGAFRHLFSY